MRKVWLTGVCLGSLALSAGAAAAQQAPSAPPPPPGASQTAVAEVIVTAEKRQERLIDVPASVTALSGRSLQQQGITSATDFTGLVPGLNVGGSGPGTSVLTIRGINTALDLAPSVGVLIDGVPIGSSTPYNSAALFSPDAATWDLNRVEVLLGPQGTLYGAAGMTGLLSYVYNPPNLARYEAAGEGEVSGTEDGGTNYAIRAMVNIPIVTDQLALRVSASHESDSGFIDDPTIHLNDVDQDREDSVRAALLWQPTQALTVKLEGDYQDINRAASDFVLYDRSTGRPASGPLQVAEGVLDPLALTVREGALTVGYDFGWASLTSITSYQSYGGSLDANYTNTGTGAALKAFGAADTLAILQPDTDKWTQELRLASDDKGQPWHYLGGFYYTGENDGENQILDGFLAPGMPFKALNPILTVHEPSVYREYAGYGQVGYTFFGRLDLTGGFRYSHDDTEYYDINGGLLGPEVPPVPPTSIGESEENYLLTARYRLTAASNVYFTASSGYRPGGPDPNVPGSPKNFGPDHLWNYEVGYKAEFLGGRAQIETDAFYITWSNIQVTGATPSGFSYVTNGKNAISEGIEAQGSITPLRGLTLSGDVAYADAHLVDAVPQVGGLAGEGLPNSPRWSGGAVADYRFPLTGNFYGFVGGSVRAIDSRFAAFDDDPALPQFYMPGYVLADLRAGVDAGRWTLTAFVHNVGDSRAELSALTDLDTATNQALVEIARPRTIGVMIDAHY